MTPAASWATRVSDRGVQFVASFEGFRPLPYKDIGGVWTIGYGTTEAVVDPLPPHVTYQEGRELLLRDLTTSVVPAILAVRKDLDQAELDALADLGYNLGAGVFGEAHTLGVDLRSEQFRETVPVSMGLYVEAAGRRASGLVYRRQREAVLWRTGSYV